MRKRIVQLAKGKFETEKPKLEFSQFPVSFSVIEGKDYTGEFTVTSTNQINIRGMIYSGDPRMTCLTPQFDGENVTIRYHFYGKGLDEGKKLTGNFYLICNQISMEIPYECAIVRQYYESSSGTIRNLDDFTNLAKNNWNEALRFFYHPAFYGVIGKSKKRQQMLYKGLYTSSNKNQSMEEFLIADERKRPIDFSLESNELCFFGIQDSVKQGVIVHKDGWGYLELEVVSEAPFIRITKKNITSEDFQGSSCRYEFILDRRKLHEGCNRGSIVISSPYKKVVLQVIASTQPEELGRRESRHLSYQKEKAQFVSLFVDHMIGHIDLATWAVESVACLDRQQRYWKNPMYYVAKAYIYAMNGQHQDAVRILNLFEEDYEDDEDRVSNEWMLYEYVYYLIEKSQGQRRIHKENIEEIYHQDMEDDFLFWMVYTMQNDYKNDGVRLQILEKRMQKGSNSPVFFAEAFRLLCNSPQFFTKLSLFEIIILRWGLRHHLFAPQLTASLFLYADAGRKFDPRVLEILEAYCNADPQDAYVEVICRYLIKGSCYGPKYIHWFETGISKDFRITGLFEAYLQSLDEKEPRELPRILQLYFQYECNLPYQKTAVLYANIISQKSKDPELYENYRKNMGHFALEQAEAGHINENLALIYDEFLPPAIVNERLAATMSHLLYRCRMNVMDPEINQLIVYQWQTKDPVIVPVINGTAMFELCTKDFVIIFEDKKGRRFADTVPCELNRMMNPDDYLETCLALAPGETSYVLHCFSLPKEQRNIKDRQKASFDRLLLSDEINVMFKADLTAEIMRYYPDLENDAPMQKYLMTADFSRIPSQSRSFLLDLMLSSGMPELAYERIREFGSEAIPAFTRSKIFSYMIRKYNWESDDFLIALSAFTFLQGTSNEDMVRYLCNNYAGPTEIMMDIWEHSTRYKIRCFEMEERILITSMYGDENPERFTPVFRHYFESGGRELIIQAFLSSCCQQYFMKKSNLDPYIFLVLQKRYVNRKEQSDAVKLALLRYFSTLGKLETVQKMIADELLAEFTGRNMNFAFYKNLDENLIQKYHLEDKVFLEYRSRPHANVSVHISRDEDGQEFRIEEMHEVYYGIYVKTFVLFFGELIRYYITEETGNKIELMESNRLMPEISGEKKDGRYHMINQMLMSRILCEDQRLVREMQQYCEASSVADSLFDIQ